MNAAVAMQNAVGWPFGQSNFSAYMMHWLRTQEFPLPPFATRNTVHCLRQIPSFTGSVENRGEGPGRP